MKKIIAMMEYAYQVLQNFPKAEKFCLAADMKRCMDTEMELVIEADNKHYKKTTLQALDTANKKLKKYVLLSFRLRFISLEAAEQTVASYQAMLKHVDMDRFTENLWANFVLTRGDLPEAKAHPMLFSEQEAK